MESVEKSKKILNIVILVPGAFVGVLVVLAALGLVWLPALWGALGLAVVYGLAVLAAAALTARRAEWLLVPVLPVVFGCFHFGYGYGFLRGILDFVVLHNAPDAQFVQLTRDLTRRPRDGRP